MAPDRPIALHLDQHEPLSPYRQLFVAVAKAIDDQDPIGLLKIGAPGDEYSVEIGTVVPLVARARTADEVIDVLHTEFSRRFGDSVAGPRDAYLPLGIKIWQVVTEYGKSGTHALLVIDVSDVVDSTTLHVLLSEKLGFPGYYGMNWDAFNDCFGEWDSAPLPRVLRIVGGSVLATRLPREAKLLRECLENLAPAHLGCRVEWAG
ncbi:MAG TPA: barstar family protein [Vicinamibacterales bacterium]|nr:barstar family protein [Vicinamibacterales bacterium]